MQRDDRPSTAEQDMYLQELVGKVLSDREESVLNLSKVVQDIEERLKWEQAANEQRYKDIKATISRIDSRLEQMAVASSSTAPAEKKSIQASKGIGSKSMKTPFKEHNGWSVDHQASSSLRHSNTIEAINRMSDKELEALELNPDGHSKELVVAGEKNEDGKYTDADLINVPEYDNKHNKLHLFTIVKLIVWDVWRPDQIPRIPWDNLMLLSMFYIVFATPYVIAFDLDMKTLNSSNSSCWIAVLDLVICGIFLTDMLFNLKTAYMKKTKSAKIIFITNRVSIVMHYLAFWFWLDLVTSIPWEFVVNVNSGNRSRDVQAARMMRILRIWRLVMLIRLMKELSKQNTKNVFDYVAKVLGRNIYAMAKLGLVVVCLIHWAGCSFYWASSWTNFDENTWVYHQNLVPNSSDGYGSADDGIRYVYSIYWATVTMAMVGYGDIVAYSIGEKFMAMFYILIGACLFAYLMGNMTAMLTSYDPAREYQEKQDADVQNFIEKRHIPELLGKNISHYYSFKVRREYRKDELAIINGLPDRIKDEVTLRLHKDFVKSIKQLHNKTPKFIAEVLERLTLDFVQPGDVIVWQGDVCHQTNFLAEGKIDIRLYNANELKRLKGELENAHADVEDDVIDEFGDKMIHMFGNFVMKGAKVLAEAQDGSRVKTQLDFVQKLAELRFRLVGRLKMGDTFGGPGCFAGDECPVTAVAKTDCELHMLDPWKMQDVKEQFPEFSADIDSLGAVCKMTVITERAIYESNKKVAAIKRDDVTGAFRPKSRAQTAASASVSPSTLRSDSGQRSSRQPLIMQHPSDDKFSESLHVV